MGQIVMHPNPFHAKNSQKIWLFQGKALPLQQSFRNVTMFVRIH